MWTQFKKANPIPKGFTGCWKNNKYTVFTVIVESGFQDSTLPMLYLSIKHNDKSPVHDWRDLQSIKNALAGTDSEGVELYPSKDRLIDCANQFHIFCLPPSIRFPFGYKNRDVYETQLELDQDNEQYGIKNGSATQRDYSEYHKDKNYPKIGIAWKYYTSLAKEEKNNVSE